MSILDAPPGIYRGTVEGPESGHCTARIELRSLPGGAVSVDYEAVSDAHGLQHIEHTVVTDGALYAAFSEGRGVTVLTSRGQGAYESTDEPRLRIVTGFADGQLSWAWHWAAPGEPVREQSRAVCTRSPGGGS